MVKRCLGGIQSGSTFELLMCGMGQLAAKTLHQFVEGNKTPFAGLLLLGWAGGISPDLSPGDIVVASTAMNTSGESLPCSAMPIPGAVHGPVVTVSTPLQDPQEKAALQGTGALAVEMEAYPLACWAQVNGLPFSHARVIYDSASERLPDMGDTLDAFGRVKFYNLQRVILTHPGFGRDLYRLYRKTQTLAPRLCALSRTVVNTWSESHHSP